MRDARLLLATRLWHLFADASVESFDEETHKSEYIFAIDQLPTCLLLKLIIGRFFCQYERVGS